MTEKRLFIMAGQVASAMVGFHRGLITMTFLRGGWCHCYCWRIRQTTGALKIRLCICIFLLVSTQDYLHSQRCFHGNVAARSVLVSADLTAKLWGLGSAYRRTALAGSPGEVKDVEMRKWQAPEVLARREMSGSSDMWVIQWQTDHMQTLYPLIVNSTTDGPLVSCSMRWSRWVSTDPDSTGAVWELLTSSDVLWPGDPPFAEVMATELLQHLQRGKHLKRPASCSSSLWVQPKCTFTAHVATSVNTEVDGVDMGSLRVWDHFNVHLLLSVRGKSSVAVCVGPENESSQSSNSLEV